ncbi:DNA invertase Pin-like site-specific DNA recombinase [Paraburkholderia sp. BL6665CI2N2]|uniref:recombinase family protein n=1 Tax=Paraburkholderia sp. BL6665CI2N2 TaxID=1938806 RepID=UPI0010656A81|nr:recombinase family protein [Paraburkholderia sp. BL6665CI2N2]TDY16898.1 DNA invertase Pin-like site-specific DNA recombinase [Paraburkholderia sp. BL6665CI2N2]
MKKIGYARVSTEDQHLDLQISALKAAECGILFEDHGVSGASFSRPGLEKALSRLKAGDTLVVWRLDRLGRSISHLVNLINRLSKRRIHFKSLTESIDTSTSGGRLVFHLMASLAEFERSLISERTKAGMDAARVRGSRIGRKPSLTAAECAHALALLECESIDAVAARFKVHPRTLYRLRAKQLNC